VNGGGCCALCWAGKQLAAPSLMHEPACVSSSPRACLPCSPSSAPQRLRRWSRPPARRAALPPAPAAGPKKSIINQQPASLETTPTSECENPVLRGYARQCDAVPQPPPPPPSEASRDRVAWERRRLRRAPLQLSLPPPRPPARRSPEVRPLGTPRSPLPTAPPPLSRLSARLPRAAAHAAARCSRAPPSLTERDPRGYDQ
jgi:hypothetical protein